LETESGLQIETRLLIVATGSGSRLPKQLGVHVPDNESAVGIRAHYENVQWDCRQTALFLEKELMPGGLYITPLPDGSCNVNLVMSLERIQKEKKPLRNHLEYLLQTHPVLKNAFANAVRKNVPEGSRLNLGLRRRSVSGSGFMLTGDAAGLIEFFSGNGIPQAYGSGMLAADTAVQALQQGNFSAEFLKAYDKALLKKYRPEKLSWLLFPMLHKPMISNAVLNFIRYLAGRPQTNNLLRDLLYSKNPEKLARNPRFLKALLLKKQNSANTAEDNPALAMGLQS
jgi:flavin-dependent dehydrogenase